MLVNLECTTSHFTPSSIPPPLLPELLFFIFSETIKDTLFSRAAGSLGSCFQVSTAWNSLHLNAELWKRFLIAHFPYPNQITQNNILNWKIFTKRSHSNHVNRNLFSQYQTSCLVYEKQFPSADILFLSFDGKIALFLSKKGKIYSFDPDKHELNLLTKLPFSIDNIKSIKNDIFLLHNQRFAILFQGERSNILKEIDKNKNWEIVKETPVSKKFIKLKATRYGYIAEGALGRGFVLNPEMQITNAFNDFKIPKNQESPETAIAIVLDKNKFHVIDFNQTTSQHDISPSFDLNATVRPLKKTQDSSSSLNKNYLFKFKVIETINCKTQNIINSSITPNGELLIALHKKLLFIDVKKRNPPVVFNVEIPTNSILEFDEKGQVAFYSIKKIRPNLIIFDFHQKNFRPIDSVAHSGPFPYYYMDGKDQAEKVHLCTLVNKIDEGILLTNRCYNLHVQGKQSIINYSGSCIKYRADLHKLYLQLDSVNERYEPAMDPDAEAQFLALPSLWKKKVYNQMDELICQSYSDYSEGVGKNTFLNRHRRGCENYRRAMAIYNVLTD